MLRGTDRITFAEYRSYIASVTDKEISIIEEKPGAFVQDDKQDALKTRPIERSLKEVTKR